MQGSLPSALPSTNLYGIFDLWVYGTPFQTPEGLCVLKKMAFGSWNQGSSSSPCPPIDAKESVWEEEPLTCENRELMGINVLGEFWANYARISFYSHLKFCSCCADLVELVQNHQLWQTLRVPDWLFSSKPHWFIKTSHYQGPPMCQCCNRPGNGAVNQADPAPVFMKLLVWKKEIKTNKTMTKIWA